MADGVCAWQVECVRGKWSVCVAGGVCAWQVECPGQVECVRGRWTVCVTCGVCVTGEVVIAGGVCRAGGDYVQR